MTLLDAFRNHGFRRGQPFSTPAFRGLDMRLVDEHSVEVDPEECEAGRVLNNLSVEGDPGFACPTVLLRVHHGLSPCLH